MAEIGIERFRAGHHQEDGAERVKADDAVVEQEVHAVIRIECQQHAQDFVRYAKGPATAMATNQTSVIGPKKAATFAVPRDCTANNATRITTVIGTTYASNAGVTIFKPSTAESTDSAGVMMASP